MLNFRTNRFHLVIWEINQTSLHPVCTSFQHSQMCIHNIFVNIQEFHNSISLAQGHTFVLNLSKKDPVKIFVQKSTVTRIWAHLMLLTELLGIHSFKQWHCHCVQALQLTDYTIYWENSSSTWKCYSPTRWGGGGGGGGEEKTRVKKFPTFYGTQRFITMFTWAWPWSLSWARMTNTQNPHVWSLNNPHTSTETYFQSHFSVNIWCSVIGKYSPGYLYLESA